MFQQIYQTALPLDDKKRENMDFIKNGKEMYIKEKAEANVVQFVTKYFDEIIDAFYTDLDSQKYIFNIHNLGENICKVQFDYRNMPHLLGMNAAGYKNDSSDSTFFNQFCANYSDFLVNLPNTIMEKFSKLFKEHSTEIINFEQSRNPELTDSLNWVRIAYKIFCVLNIGNIGDVNDCVDKTYFFTGLKFNNMRQIFILRKVLSVNYDDSYILISFNVDRDLSEPLDPESIKMVHVDQSKICRSFDYSIRKVPSELIDEFKNIKCLKMLNGCEIEKINRNSKERK